MLALAAQLKLPLYQLDVKSAFLNGTLEEDVYISQPQGFIANGSENKVYKLKKVLYGLKQAPLKQDLDGIFVCQKKYAADLLKKFNMLNCEVAVTPMNINEKIQHEDGTGAANPRFLNNPTRQHLGAAKRILRYVAGISDFGVWYSKTSSLKLIGFTDSDWVGSLDDRKSTSGSIFFLGSGAITRSSKKQETVALSSSEAEYAAASSAARQALWLRKLLADVGYLQTEATDIFCDNRSAIAMSRNPAFHARMKHIDVQHHFVRQLSAERKIDLKFCGTNEQVADIFTKALFQAKNDFFRMQLGVCNFESRGGVE
ncbi:hypothetical protein AgCh_020162 [Apium graveolens]